MTKFVWHGATGAADGSTWADAYTTVAAGLSGAANDELIAIAHNHSETLGTSNTNFSGKNLYNNAVNLVSCTQQASGTATVFQAATAVQFGVSTNNYAQFLLSITCWGVYVEAGGNLNFAAQNGQVQDMYHCTFECSTADNNSVFTLNNEGYTRFYKCTFVNSRTGVDNQPYCATATRGRVDLYDCTFAPTVAVTRFTGALFSMTVSSELNVCGGDASSLTSLASVLSDASANSYSSVYRLEAPSGVTLHSVTESQALPQTIFDDANARDLDQTWVHATIASSTANVRTGGASDGASYAWLMTTTSACKIGREIYSPWITIWVDSTGSKTFDVYINSDDAGWTDTDCWLETEYPDATTSSEVALATTRNADPLAAGTALTADSTSTWTTNNTRYKLTDTLTVNTKGLVRCRVCVAVDITDNLYIDPLITVT